MRDDQSETNGPGIQGHCEPQTDSGLMTRVVLVQEIHSLLAGWEEWHADARQLQSQTRVADVLSAVIARGRGLSDGLPMTALLASQVAEIEGVTPATVRSRCACGEYPGAHRPAAGTSPWLIPLEAILERRDARGRDISSNRGCPSTDLLQEPVLG